MQESRYIAQLPKAIERPMWYPFVETEKHKPNLFSTIPKKNLDPKTIKHEGFKLNP